MSNLSRRKFIKMASAVPIAAMLPQWMPRLSFAPKNTAPRGDVFVYIFLRGAADGLNIVVPHADDDYYRLRPTIGIPRPDDSRTAASERTLNLDDRFGLHPSLAPLMPIWAEKDLAIVHAVGAPDDSHSHFKAMELIERGVDSKSGASSGWLGRHLASLDTGNHSPLRGVSIGEMVTRSLRGPVPATALRSIADFHFGGEPRAIVEMQSALNALYSTGDPLDALAMEAMATLETVGAMHPESYRPTGDTLYPEDDFGMGLRQVAMLVKAQAGLEVACLDMGEWDTHVAQGRTTGWMPTLLASLGQGLRAFYDDLASEGQNIVTVVMSEFGRRVKENGGAGTDHGHGGAMFVLGNQILGGKVYGDFPGLSSDALWGPGDLAVTTDYRDVLGEILAKRLNNPQLDVVFPDYTPRFINLVS